MTQEKTQVLTLALPTSLEEVKGLADAFIKSGMFADTRGLAQAIVKIQAGRELGLPPVYAMQNINLIRDRLTTSANTMAMLVKRSGKYNYKIESHTDTECKIEFFENGKSAGWSSFTIEDAKRADLVKAGSGWVKFPRAMLFSRAISQGARLYAPDAIGGVYTDEEIKAIPPSIADTEALRDDSVEPQSTPPVDDKLVQAYKEHAQSIPDDMPTLVKKSAPPDGRLDNTGFDMDRLRESQTLPKSSPLIAETPSSPPAPDATRSEILGIDLPWVRENIRVFGKRNDAVLAWLRSKANYVGLDLSGSLTEVIARMDTEQKEFLTSEISERLEMK